MLLYKNRFFQSLLCIIYLETLRFYQKQEILELMHNKFTDTRPKFGGKLSQNPYNGQYFTLFFTDIFTSPTIPEI